MEVYLRLEYGIRRIAQLLNLAPPSVSRELKRSPNYAAEKPQNGYVSITATNEIELEEVSTFFNLGADVLHSEFSAVWRMPLHQLYRIA